MTNALLDTTVFIDHRLGYQPALNLVSRSVQEARTLYFSPITIFELWLRRMHHLEEAVHLSLLGRCKEAPFDRSAALVMASWLRDQPRSGRKRLLGDAMIAATAASLGATILTRNPRDFTRFYPDVESY